MKQFLIFVGVLFVLVMPVRGAIGMDAVPPLPGLEGESVENFETYLRAHPEDEFQRVRALGWYARGLECSSFALTRLKHHTFKMIEYHPANMEIYFKNASAFYLDRGYCLEVISKLEGQVKAGHKEVELLWMLAMTCERAAVPPKWCDAEDRKRFLGYHGLPESTIFPDRADVPLAEKAIGYYRSAIKEAGEDGFYIGMYSEQLGDLLLDLNRQAEALDVCEKALPRADETSKPGLLVTYGRALRAAGRLDKARGVLEQVRFCDKEGNEDGPGCDTTEAETYLGLIALDERKPAEAGRWLVSSCKVQECCHSTTKGFSLNLAKKLLDAGEYDAVTKFCRTVLDEFTPDDDQVKALMQRAADAKKAGRKS